MNPPDALQLLIISHAREAETGDFPKGKHYVEAIHNAFVRQEANELVRELSLVDEQGQVRPRGGFMSMEKIRGSRCCRRRHRS